MLDPIALVFWAIAHKISLRKVGFVFSKAALRKHDVLFFMHYGNFTFEDVANAQRGDELAIALSDVDILKLGHFTHYAYQPAIGSKNLEKLGVKLLVAENNLLKNSDFYRKHFGHLDTEFWCLPFIAAERFKKQTPFRDRACKLVATGSITFKMTDPDFISFFQTDELQPLRRQIYENSDVHAAEIDSMISDLNASRVRDRTKKKPFWGRVLKKFIPHVQHSYYRKNIVDIYNSYMMFTVPEEVCDLPAIGVVEGMACGCAFFGVDSPMYRDLGMVPGFHYVAYNGSLVDLVEKVRLYQRKENFDRLERIAQRGYELVSKNLRGQAVYSEFCEQLNGRVNKGECSELINEPK
ncbi:glycosyltransferase [Luminiphilus sp. nBUS_07]|uniref:glycosyltransferase n=1 Tax=Luminiphilus sp. nBUS_07 TaxID=3395314 RepID=UPI003EC12663